VRNPLLRSSIRQKVVACFGVVVVMTVILGLFSLRELGAVNDAAAEIRDDWLPATQILGEIKFTTMRYRQIEAAHILQSDLEAKAKEAATMRKLAGDVQALFAKHRALVTSENERRRSDTIVEQWSRYLALSKELVATSIAGDTTAAVGRYTGDLRSTFNKYFADLQEVIDATVTAGKQAADGGAGTYAAARIWIAGWSHWRLCSVSSAAI